MESESESGPAVAALAEHDRVAQRARASAVSREYALLLTGADALTVVYLATFLFAEVAAPGGAGRHVNALLVVMLVGSAAVGGAGERFSVRPRSRATELLAFVPFAAGFVLLMAFTLLDVDFPAWAAALVVALFAAALALNRVRTWRHAVADDASTWLAPILSVPARCTTTIVAVLFAAFAATTPWEFAPTFGALISLPVMMAMLLAWVTPFGAARLGYEWRRIHWLAFACASTAVFASVLLAATVPGYSWPASVALAVIGAAPLCASAFVTLVRR